MRAFDEHARDWHAYTCSPLGRLRHDLPLQQLRNHLRDPLSGLQVLDAGCGSSGLGFPLAQLGAQVTFLDFSEEMLGILRQRLILADSRLGERVEFACLPVEEALVRFGPGRFDLVLCHTLLEFLDDPLSAVAALAALLRKGGLLSLVVTNPHGDVLRSAIGRQDPREALQALGGPVSAADLFGLPRATVVREDLLAALRQAGAEVVAEYGVRVFADCLPAERLLDQSYFELVRDLELAAGSRQPYVSIGRYTHLVARAGR